MGALYRSLPAPNLRTACEAPTVGVSLRSEALRAPAGARGTANHVAMFLRLRIHRRIQPHLL